MAEIKTEGFDELVKKLVVVAPTVLKKMAFNVTAGIAAEGRRKEQQQSHFLVMGVPQRKGADDQLRVRSRWDPGVGWVSTTRSAGKGGTGFRMASFAWERVHKAKVRAEYTNQLANLWHRPSRPYRYDSPEVGQAGMHKVWERGQRRPAKYRWSRVYSILSASVPKAIARTEAEFGPKLERL